MLVKLLFGCFIVLVTLTPLIWRSTSYELFEYNKMFFVYLVTIIISAFWLMRMILGKQLFIKRTPLDIPILLFLFANILSTIFSIEPHTSFWGYYSRLNGGLLSTITYTTLFYALVSNINREQAITILKAGLVGGFIVALWAIPEHFGISPSCVMLTHNLNASCWVQDVQARVFATLGQANWLAAYLSMLIFPAIYFFMGAKGWKARTWYGLLIASYYIAFTFTYSRGATLGLIGGLGVLATIAMFHLIKSKNLRRPSWPKIASLMIIGILLGINLLFGSAFIRFQGISLNLTPPPPPSQTTSVTQLDNGGTESGQIRLIVWKGALDIFKAYPVFGSGLETFAYSYYKYRPVEHNLVSEWDFLYNKAHNEYLNYLATTGTVGLGSYLLLIGWFVFWIGRRILSVEFKVKKEKVTTQSTLFYAAILASYLSYLIQNFFLFSVVITAVFFYLFPALSLVRAESTSNLVLPQWLRDLYPQLFLPLNPVGWRKIPYFTMITVVIVVALLGVVKLGSLVIADDYFAKGNAASDNGDAGEAFSLLTDAVQLNPEEPFYRSELGHAAAAAAVALQTEDATLSGALASQSALQTQLALTKAPANISYWRTAIRTYYQLAAIDPLYKDLTLSTIDHTISLAPTDAKLYYNKALLAEELLAPAEATPSAKGPVLGVKNERQISIDSLKKSIELKPNYREAYLALALFYEQNDQMASAKEAIDTVFKLVPNDPEALEIVKKWTEQQKK